MVTSLFADSGRTWREAARVNSKSRLIYEALRNELRGPIGGAVNFEVQRNADLIKSIPQSVAKDVTNYIAEESFKGRRAEEIAKDLQKEIPGMLESKAKLIARTEVSKTSTSLTKARSENMGISWYIWRSCEDQRVRSSHAHMEGVLVNWNEAPNPEKLIGVKSRLGNYHAGMCPNCRCYPEVVVSLNVVKWPCKIYRNGRIQNITRKEFEEIM